MFVRSDGGADAALQELVLRFLQPANPSFESCWSLHTVRLLWWKWQITPHPLLYACVHGLMNSIECLWEQAPPSSTNKTLTSTALHAASFLGIEDVVRLLLSKGVPADIPIERYGTCLQSAAFHGRLKVVEALLEGGADVNKKKGWFNSALQAASMNGHVDIAKLLLDWHAIIDSDQGFCGSALNAAAYRGHRELVDLLIRNGADVNLQRIAYSCDDFWTKRSIYGFVTKERIRDSEPAYCGNALHAAISGHHIDLAYHLLELGADVHAKGGCNGNALQAACREGHQQLAQKLVDRGADVNAYGRDNCTALRAAVQIGHEDLVRFLIEKGATIDIRCESQRTLLELALTGDSMVIVQLLSDHGTESFLDVAINVLQRPKPEAMIPHLSSARVLQKDEAHSKTILHWAAETGHEDVVHRCLELGADVQARDRYGETVLHYAAENGHLASAKLLVEGGSEVEAVDGHGRTPLVCASGQGLKDARSCHPEVFRYLIEIRDQLQL